MAGGVGGVVPQPLAGLREELLLGEDVEQVQRAQVLALLEERHGVRVSFLGDAREELGVDDEALEVGQGVGEAGEEAGRVAQAEELEGEGFDGRGKRGDVPGLGEDGLVFVDFDVGGEGQGFEAAGFRGEGWDGEGLERDLGERSARC